MKAITPFRIGGVLYDDTDKVRHNIAMFGVATTKTVVVGDDDEWEFVDDEAVSSSGSAGGGGGAAGGGGAGAIKRANSSADAAHALSVADDGADGADGAAELAELTQGTDLLTVQIQRYVARFSDGKSHLRMLPGSHTYFAVQPVCMCVVKEQSSWVCPHSFSCRPIVNSAPGRRGKTMIGSTHALTMNSATNPEL
jgi:hypothetical protein